MSKNTLELLDKLICLFDTRENTVSSIFGPDITSIINIYVGHYEYDIHKEMLEIIRNIYTRNEYNTIYKGYCNVTSFLSYRPELLIIGLNGLKTRDRNYDILLTTINTLLEYDEHSYNYVDLDNFGKKIYLKEPFIISNDKYKLLFVIDDVQLRLDSVVIHNNKFNYSLYNNKLDISLFNTDNNHLYILQFKSPTFDSFYYQTKY